MQREIKFRVWDKETKRMRNDVLVYGNGTHVLPLGSEVLMQFTGLKDKNGKEIYEGDIIETGTAHKFKIEWNEACAMWTLDGLQEFMMKMPDGSVFPQNQYCEVIGNIYENKELLKN